MDHLISQNFNTNPGIMYKLGSIEAQLTAINEKLDKKEGEQDEKITKLERRLGVLETWRTGTLAGAAVIATLITFLQKVIPWQNLF